MAWSNAKPMSNRERKPRLDEEVDIFQFPPNKWTQVRYVAPFNSYAWGWIRTRNTSGKGGKKYNRFPKVCLDYNPRTQNFDKEICPYRKNGVYMQQRYISNMIVRDLQEDKPRRMREPTRAERKQRTMLGEKWRCKERGSKTWTPVRVQDMPPSVAEKLANLSELNTRRRNGKKIAYDIADPRYGMDVLVKFNPDAKNPSMMWEVQRAEPTKLSRDELDYLIYDISNLESLQPEDRKTAREQWKRIEKDYRPEKRGDDNKRGKSSSRSTDRDKRRSSSRRRDNSSSRRDRDTGSRRATTAKTRRPKSSSKPANKRRAGGGRKWDNLDNLDNL